MGLFDNFKDTIFFKNYSELELQIKSLKKVMESYPENQGLKRKLTLCELGLKGEQEIEFELKSTDIGMYVLHDINLRYGDMTAQVDYIVITPAKVYFIECKNLTGNITVNSNGNFVREWTYNGCQTVEGIYSPLRQAERHVEIYKKIWLSRNQGLLKRIMYQNMDNWYIPLVVMANSENVLDLSNAPTNIRKRVIRADNLISYIKRDIACTDKNYLWSRREMEKVAYIFLNSYNCTVNRDYVKEYMEYAKKSGDTSELKNKLLDFRKERSKAMNIPAYYVFTNEELEQLLLARPKSIDELKNLKILSPIKATTHGEEIVKILQGAVI